MKNKKLQEEKRKYENNEDFTAFLREQAQKRKIANIFSRVKGAIAAEEAEESKSKEIQE